MTPTLSAIKKLSIHQDLSEPEAQAVLQQVLEGHALPAQVAAWLTALHIQGLTVDELTGMAKAVAEKTIKVQVPYPVIVDLSGTGGPLLDALTPAAFILAAGGVKVAKYGRRSTNMSWSDTFDILQSLGTDSEKIADQVEETILLTNLGFVYAPVFHNLLEPLAALEKEIGLSVLAPWLPFLAHPAQSKHRLIGVSDASKAELFIQTLKNLGVQQALVVHAEDGADKISLMAPTRIYELKDGQITSKTIQPEDFGFHTIKGEAIVNDTPPKIAKICREVLSGTEQGPRREYVLLSAAAGFYLAGKVSSLEEGIKFAALQIDEGHAQAKLEEYITVSIAA